MAILWAGMEDIDWLSLNGAGVTTSNIRAGWARVGLYKSATGSIQTTPSNPFTAVTSAWLSFQCTKDTGHAGDKLVQFALSGTDKGLGVGLSTTSGNRLCIYKFDGTTRTELAAEAGNSFTDGNILQKIDFQVVNYGASATVNIYRNGVSLVTYTGDVTVSGMTNFNSVSFMLPNGATSYVSEFVVMDSDTRGLQGLQVLALTGAGTTNNWTNPTYTDINGTSFSDANPTYVNTTAADQQYTVTTPTPPVYTVVGVAISARMAAGPGSVPTQVKLGYKSGGSVAFGTGAAKTPTSAYATYQQIDMINPVTGVAFTQSDLAALQLDLRSA